MPSISTGLVMNKGKKKKKELFIDNDITIANMNVEGMPWYKNQKEIKRKKDMQELSVTRKERRAIIWGAFLAYLPAFLIIIASFILIYFILYLLLFR